MRLFIGLFSRAALILSLGAPTAFAEVTVTPRHLMILREGLDTLYGSYVFAVQNSSDKPEHFRTPVMLPKEADDFSPQEGVEAAEVTLAPGGGVVVEKDFAPGVQIVSIGFRVPAHFGKGQLTLTPGIDVESFTLLLPRQSGLTARSPVLAVGEASSAPDPQYEPLVNAAPLRAGQTTVIEVEGMPEGRSRIWIVGGGVAAMLLGLAGVFAWRTKPKLSADAGGTVLVG